MYDEVLRLIPFMERYAEHYDLYDEKRNLDSLSTLTLQELWIMNTIERIGATGRGIRIHQGSGDQESRRSLFRVPLTSSKELLDLYSKYTKFYESKDFVYLLSRFSLVPSNLKEGIDIIKELSENNQDNPAQKDTWPPCGERVTDSGSETEILRADDSMGNYVFFSVRKDAAYKLKELQLEFGQWLSDLKGVHPFHRFYEEWTSWGELYYNGYVNEYGRQDFIDWLNVEKYDSWVAYKIEAPTAPERFVHLDF